MAQLTDAFVAVKILKTGRERTVAIGPVDIVSLLLGRDDIIDDDTDMGSSYCTSAII